MRCPFCGGIDTQVKDSRPAEDNNVTRRRRECSSCGARFSSVERVVLRNLMVAKKDGSLEPFDREKLTRSIQVALRKRDINIDRIEQMVSGLVRRLETSGSSSVTSESVGEIVMQNLARIDPVAYVRFASVYKNFRDVDDFEEFLNQLKPREDDD